MKITKKKIKQITENYHAIEQNTSDLLGLDSRLKAIELHLFELKDKTQPESPTSAENAQVEKPIEFGCWVKTVRAIKGTNITEGASGIVTHQYSNGFCDVFFRSCSVTIEVLDLKRIKSPIE